MKKFKEICVGNLKKRRKETRKNDLRFRLNLRTKIAINLAIKPYEHTKPPLTKCQKFFNSHMSWKKVIF